MQVLVTGGTGYVGSHVCRELDDRGHEVTALSRTPDDADLPDGVATARGDVTDYASIEGAFSGMDAVVNLVALSPLYKPRGGNEMHDRVHRAGTANAVRAAEAAEVERFFQMSGIHADPNGPTAYLRAKGRAEDIVRGSSLSWVIFRPTVIFGPGGEFIEFTKRVALPYVTPLPGGGTMTFQPIWIEDIVPMMADAVEDEGHAGEIYRIGGPERLTLAEIARLAHGAEGRPVNVVPIPMPLAGIGMTIGGAIPRFPLGADQYRSLKLDLAYEETDVSAFGVDPDDLLTLAEYLESPARESRATTV